MSQAKNISASLIRDLYAIICDNIKEISPRYHKYVKIGSHDNANSYNYNFDNISLPIVFDAVWRNRINVYGFLLLLLDFIRTRPHNVVTCVYYFNCVRLNKYVSVRRYLVILLLFRNSCVRVVNQMLYLIIEWEPCSRNSICNKGFAH